MVSSRIIFNAALFRELTVPKFVFAFTEGNKDLKDLLGGKGALTEDSIAASGGSDTR
jgi:hypothetical protein